MIEIVSRTRVKQWTRDGSGRIVFAIAAVLLLAAAGILIVQHLLPADLLRKQVVAQIQRSTGFSAKIYGPAELRFFLRPRIVIQNLRIADASGAVELDAPRVVGYLRLLPLLVGRFEIGHAVLYQPKLIADLDRGPVSRGGVVQQAIRTTGGDVAGLQAPLGVISVVDGEALVKTKKVASSVTLDAINMYADWPRLGASADFSGDVIFRGVPMRLRGWLERPLDVLRGGESASILQLKSPILTFWSSGRLSGGSRLQYNGSISATAPSLRKLAEKAGYSFSKHGTFANLDLSCDVDIESGNAAFTNLTLHLDGNDYQGNLEIRDIAHVPHFSGTLASDFLDVTPFLIGLREPTASGALWNHKPIDLEQLDLADLDLRVSAARLRIYNLEVHDAALSLLTKPGLIDLALAEATSNNGVIRGRFELAKKSHTFDLRVSGSASGIDVQPMVFDGQRPLSGSLNGSIGLESSGANLDALMQGLSGQAALSVGNGSFAGVDLIPTLAGGANRKTGEKLAVVRGTTNFDHLTLDLRLAHGVATIKDGKVSGQNLQLGLGGTLDVGHRQLDILSLGQITPAGKSPGAIPARFELKGPWSAPSFYQGPADLHLPKPAHANDSLPDMTAPPPPAEE
jgi:AsmA protein